MSKTIIFLSFFLFAHFVYSVPAKIITETAVYEKNDFDSDIIKYFSVNKQVQASKRVYQGKFFGSFRKVRLSKLKYGFISDVDVKLLTTLKKQKAKLKRRLKEFKRERLSQQYVYLNHYVGLGVSFSRFSEKNVEGQRQNLPLQAITFQAIGPGSIFPRLPLNFSISYAELPSYYEELNTDKTKALSGYTVFGDLSYPMILSDQNYLLIYWSVGASFRLLKGTVYKKGGSGILDYSEDLSKYYFGALLSSGILWDFSKKFSARLDARYHYNGGVFFEDIQTTLLFKY